MLRGCRCRRRRSSNSLTRLFAVCAALMIACALYAEMRLPKLREELCRAALTSFAEKRIAELVPDCLDSIAVQEGEQVTLDTYSMSRMKSELTDVLQDALTCRVRTWVPIGSLTGSTVLNGRGFKVPVVFYAEAVVSVSFRSETVSFGINRTGYSVTMAISSRLYSSSNAGSVTVEVAAEYPIYESVLSGEVPYCVPYA